jgi:hypothetical protein
VLQYDAIAGQTSTKTPKTHKGVPPNPAPGTPPSLTLMLDGIPISTYDPSSKNQVPAQMKTLFLLSSGLLLCATKSMEPARPDAN